MGELWRSQEMQLVQLFVQYDAAHDTVDELGKLGLIQFRDLNPDVSPFQRNFVNEVKRCDEMERRLTYFSAQIASEEQALQEEKKEGGLVKLEESRDDPPRTKEFKDMNELETHLEETEKELIQMSNNHQMLQKNFVELIELRHVLQKDTSFFDENIDLEKSEEVEETQAKPLVDKTDATLGSRAVKLGFITGVVQRDKFISFERVLWRVLRGNLFMKHAEIEERLMDFNTGESVEKNVFIIFYQGERAQSKIKKICESFASNLYTIPETTRERKDLLNQVHGRIEDLQKVIDKTNSHRRAVLHEIQSKMPTWNEKVVKEKAIYHIMNMFNYDVGRKLLIAEGWCPKTATDKIVAAMRTATEVSGALVPSVLSVVQSNDEPPTYFRTNKFTSSFQAIVDAYGIAQYQEVNPAALTVITFPFLFAVMFGDFGHGIILSLFASYLIWKEDALAKVELNEMIKTCYSGRYVLLLMGLFSMYTGLLYNECFSIPIDFCGSNWAYNTTGNGTIAGAYRIDNDRTYEFGVDPAWKGSDNMLAFYNSLKMKMSVIFGVIHMSVGIFMSLLNGLHFRKPLNIFAEFIPQILFLLCLFGYMDFLIFFKWSYSWTGQSPPFLLNVMIQMFLHPQGVTDENRLYNGQDAVQIVLILVAVLCIPWMLVIKPYVLKYQHKKKMLQSGTSLVEEHPKPKSGGGHDHGEGEEFDFGEIFVKQIIHTIEFVLGAISNTASYLRLWALSLAHAELSEVFWERALLQTYEVGGFYAIFIGFAIWAGMTFGVLLVMESLSAFLHALRLHWVEFQSKFYHGDGYKFVPFSYSALLAGDEQD